MEFVRLYYYQGNRTIENNRFKLDYLNENPTLNFESD